jgi:hypothetical protein
MVMMIRFINLGQSAFIIVRKDHKGTDKVNWLFLHVLVPRIMVNSLPF